MGEIRAGSATEHHQAPRIRDRQRSQQHAVQRAENRRIGAYAKAEAEYREHREAGRSLDLSNGVPQVVAEIVKETYAPSIPVFLLDLVESAHLQPCSPHCFVVRQAAGDMAVYQSFEMKPELVVQVLFNGTAPDERPKPVSEIGEHRGLRLHAFHDSRDA